MNCINLRNRFGDRYRISFDPAYDPRHRPKKCLDPWMMILPCRYGEIYPDGGQFLRVDIDGHNRIAARVTALDGCMLVQDGDVEKTIRFPVTQFELVAALVHPHRRRRVSDDERCRLRALSRQHGFAGQKHQPGSVPGVTAASCSRA
ncbi:MAG: hypothetical protein ACK5Q5_07200 [Planctomycetaceae bacterium]